MNIRRSWTNKLPDNAIKCANENEICNAPSKLIYYGPSYLSDDNIAWYRAVDGYNLGMCNDINMGYIINRSEPKQCYTISGSQTDSKCLIGEWSDWSQCSATCGTSGMKKRERSVSKLYLDPDLVCPSSVELENCNTQPCPVSPISPIPPIPVDCKVSDWSMWSQCSATCGTGSRTKTRTVERQPQYGGRACPSLAEQENCNTQPCQTSLVLTQSKLLSTKTFLILGLILLIIIYFIIFKKSKK